MAQRVRTPHRGRMPFVCHSTPHFDSTSREEPYSVALIIHHKEEKVNPQFAFFDKIFPKENGKEDREKAKTSKTDPVAYKGT